MNKGFTLFEALISIVIVGVLSAILIPSLSCAQPDNDRVMFKKDLYIIQEALVVVMSRAFPPDYLTAAEFGPSTFCEKVAESINTVGSVNCGVTGSFDSPNFVTVGGSMWWGLGGGKFDLISTPTKVIIVDVNGETGDNTVGVDQLRMRIGYDGRLTTDAAWIVENKYMSDVLQVQK